MKEFATTTQFEMYDNMLLQRSLSQMEDVVQCPRRGCSITFMADNPHVARCPACSYVFCPRCLRLNHPNRDCTQTVEDEIDDIDEVGEEAPLPSGNTSQALSGL